MNNTTLSQLEGFKKYFSTTHTVSTEMPTLPATTSPSRFEPGKKNTLSCNTTVNENFLPRPSAFLFDERLCYSNPEPNNGNFEKISANLDDFDLDISGQPQDTTTNQLDGFLLHQLTQNDMDILLSLSLVPETTTTGDNDTVLGPTIEYDQSSKEIHSNTNSETTGEESTDGELLLKNLFQQDDSVYFDPIFLQNFSRAVIESQMYPESDMSSEKGQQHDKEESILSCPSEEEPNDSIQGGHRLPVCLWANCGEVFINLQDLISHLSEEHMGKGKATYRCEWEGCPRISNPFTKRHKMYAHLRIHTGERPFVCPEPGCKKQFTRPDSLTNHIKTHSKIKTFLCKWEGCDKAYFYSRSLKKHEGTHKAPKPEQTQYQKPRTEQHHVSSQTQPSQLDFLSENSNSLSVPLYQSLVEFTNGHYDYLA